MPTELEELVGFIVHPNPQIRLLATENLVSYSSAQPSIFKADELKPVRNLKILLADHPKIAEHAISILINLSGDPEVLRCLATDQKFLNLVFARVTNPAEANANLLAMLLANLAKADELGSVVERKQQAPEGLGSDECVLNQLVDLFVRGANNSLNKAADYDYLAYFFADVAKHAAVRRHLMQRQAYDDVIPLTKIKVFTEHRSVVRRQGVASTLKNVAFDVPSHAALLAEDDVDVLPYLLLPLAGSEAYDEGEMLEMLPDLQFLPPDKQREADPVILQTHVETLTLLTTTRSARDYLRQIQVYPLIRETHLRVEDEGVREACDRLVQVLMRDEEDAVALAAPETLEASKVHPHVKEDEDERIVEV